MSTLIKRLVHALTVLRSTSLSSVLMDCTSSAKDQVKYLLQMGGQSYLIVMRFMNIESIPPDVKPGDAKKRPDCKCSNGTLADWNR